EEGREWTPDQKLAGMGGHYQNSEPYKDEKIGTAFNMHPGGNVDKRTNLYYVETPDFGKTWQNVQGETVETPLTDKHCPALVRDFESEGRLVYLKDLRFDSEGNPIILIITSNHHMPGPKGDPRTWTIAHWKGGEWQFHEVTNSTHNYDMGQLWIEDGRWRIFGPTEPGPQPWGAGGEVALWESTDEGATWNKIRTLTHNSPLNHTYVRRPVNAHPDFYALWADGNTYVHSDSHLYFTNQAGEKVWRLPYEMEGEFGEPEVVE
ncbi:MAG: BNR-4 repeat-containing protein, partial [Candidatus Omnitrophica bacterium]|nr:BNR-4 repeat-containing protein [Candidatus Omnitrophota bacterium]